MNIGLAIVMIFIEQPHIALTKIATMIETGFVAKTGNAGWTPTLTWRYQCHDERPLNPINPVVRRFTNEIQPHSDAMVPLTKRLKGAKQLLRLRF